MKISENLDKSKADDDNVIVSHGFIVIRLRFTVIGDWRSVG